MVKHSRKEASKKHKIRAKFYRLKYYVVQVYDVSGQEPELDCSHKEWWLGGVLTMCCEENNTGVVGFLDSGKLNVVVLLYSNICVSELLPL